MRKICVFTGSRAEYGLLKPLMDEIRDDPDLDLQIVASGMHLSPEFGMTYREIENDGFKIDEKIEILTSSDSAIGVSKSMGLGMISFCEAFNRLKPDFLVVLGDRFETFSAVASAMVVKIPVAHLHGGELTLGAIDDAMRHSITKMSHLHFASTECYRKRVIQMGEKPEHVFNVGAIGLDNIMKMNLAGRHEIEGLIKYPLGENYFLVTYHPETLGHGETEAGFRQLLNALNRFEDYKVIFTFANADANGRIVNQMIKDYVEKNTSRAVSYVSLGQFKYLSLLKYSKAVIGNSSSGIIEAPGFGVPTVNIGDRQKGRIQAASIVNCKAGEDDINQAIEKVLSETFRTKLHLIENPYQKQNTALNIKNRIKSADLNNILLKEFYDIPVMNI